MKANVGSVDRGLAYRRRASSAEPAICAKRRCAVAGPCRCRTRCNRGVPVLPALPSRGAEHLSIGSEEIGPRRRPLRSRCSGVRRSGIYATEVTEPCCEF
jgi:hypothetical protein